MNRLAINLSRIFLYLAIAIHSLNAYADIQPHPPKKVLPAMVKDRYILERPENYIIRLKSYYPEKDGISGNSDLQVKYILEQLTEYSSSSLAFKDSSGNLLERNNSPSANIFFIVENNKGELVPIRKNWCDIKTKNYFNLSTLILINSETLLETFIEKSKAANPPFPVIGGYTAMRFKKPFSTSIRGDLNSTNLNGVPVELNYLFIKLYGPSDVSPEYARINTAEIQPATTNSPETRVEGIRAMSFDSKQLVLVKDKNLNLKKIDTRLLVGFNFDDLVEIAPFPGQEELLRNFHSIKEEEIKLPLDWALKACKETKRSCSDAKWELLRDSFHCNSSECLHRLASDWKRCKRDDECVPIPDECGTWDAANKSSSELYSYSISYSGGMHCRWRYQLIKRDPERAQCKGGTCEPMFK